MIEYRNREDAQKRLLAYYKKYQGEEMFPIEKSRNKYLIELLNLLEDEYLINAYPLTFSNVLFVSSKKIIINNVKKIIDIEYADVLSVYIEFPYKSKTLHELSVVLRGQKIFKIQFLDLQSLVNARNEIYRVINTVILNWVGRDFRVNNAELANYEVVSLTKVI